MRLNAAIEREKLGTSTKKPLAVLCYQHHTEMLSKQHSATAEAFLYVCRQPTCLICYKTSQGYFINAEDAKTMEQEIAPRVHCPQDERPMYLAKVMPERSSFRLWKCPECNATRTSEESSHGLRKRMRA
jgi:alpha-ketoglutarate-dependent taurine dioxygenase